ncbi:MAG: hypothetical protein IJ113_04675 [Eggerthellaceae bacterium]|nr:hypothetical protein [Eggerthellaceae bacterium]
MYKNGKHIKAGSEVTLPQHSLRTRIGAAAAAGCLALALVPAVALAEPAGAAPQDNGGQAPAAQQGIPQDQGGMGAPGGFAPDGFAPGAPSGSFDSQNTDSMPPSMPSESGENGNTLGNMPQPPAAPDGQAPDGQAPATFGDDTSGQLPPSAPTDNNMAMQNRELDERIINAIEDEDIRARALAGNPDTENKRPPIPEGEVNVQQLIDSIRNSYLGEMSDTEMPAQNGEALNTNAPEPKDLPEGETAQKPADLPELPSANKDDSADKTSSSSSSSSSASASTGSRANATTGTTPAPQNQVDQQAPTGDDTSALDIFKRIVESVLKFLRGE